MAFVEPQSLIPWPPRSATWDRPRPRRLGPEELKLLEKWSASRRLLVRSADGLEAHEYSTVEGFPKNDDEDRQIIDRRGRNGAEGRLVGESRFIPGAYELVDIFLGSLDRLMLAGSDLLH